MKIHTLDEYPAMPWKNGGGITREIALKEDAGGFLWRLSLADVDQDGPFSAFPGRHRILTVISGAGIRLIDADTDTVLTALPHDPVHFDGRLAIQGALIDGPIRDLNVMIDPTRIQADVTVLRDSWTLPPADALTAIFCLAGTAECNGVTLTEGSTAFLTEGDTAMLNLSEPAALLCIQLTALE